MDTFEYKTIKNKLLPASWQESSMLNNLYDFLQSNWEQRKALFDDEKVESKQQFVSFKENGNIHTEGYIGTIIFNGEQLNIYPRVFKEDMDDEDTSGLSHNYLMSNLIQWISYCNKMNYPFINMNTEISDSKDLLELFISLYIGYVDSALQRGLYFKYIDETNDLKYIKGKINIKDYFLNKIPMGRYNEFECNYSKFEFDNKVNQVIKYTCIKLLNLTNERNQKKLRHILMKMDEVSLVTCKPVDCDNHRFNRMNNHYRLIMSLSKMFLLNSAFSMDMDINDAFCFLFPTNLLFEGFIGGFIQELLENEGGKVWLQRSDMSLIDKVMFNGVDLGTSHKMRHDIFINYSNKEYIMDTKYKEISRFEGEPEYVKATVDMETNQNDINQVCEYARKRGLKDVYLLYPMFNREDDEKDYPIGISQSEYGDINVHFVRLPFVFNNDVEKMIERLKNTIHKILEVV